MKEEVLNNDKDHNTNNKVSIWKRISKFLGTIGLGIPTIYVILNFTYNFIYQSSCEEFYGIDGKYFESSINESFLYLVCIAILFIYVYALAKIDKNTENEIYQRKDTKYSVYFCGIMAGILIGITNISAMFSIIENILLKCGIIENVNAFVLYIVVVLLFIMGAFSPFCFIGNEKLQEIKSILKKALNIIAMVSAVFTSLLLLMSIILKFSISIEDKTKYEFVNINQTEYVVLSEYDGSVLVVLYDVNEEGQYVFYTKNYYLFERNEGTYRYENLKYSPIVNKGDRMD